MSVIITIQGRRLKLEAGDDVNVENHLCGRCDGEHTEITVTRNGKKIASLGDYITLYGEDEVYGGVVVDDKDVVLPNPHWVIHIIPNDGSGMTAGGIHYVGMCGKVLDRAPGSEHDRITFSSDLKFIERKDENRICPKCLGNYKEMTNG